MNNAMDMVRSRLKNKLHLLRTSVREASIGAGMNPDTLGKFMSGKTQSLKANNLSALAEYLDVSESWLLGTTDDHGEAPNVGTLGVSFGGIVEAGAFRPTDNHNQDDEVRVVEIPPDPRYPARNQHAFKVVGDSMTEAKIFEGMHVLAVDVMVWERTNGDPPDGALVIVARTRNGNPERELTVKRLRLHRDRMVLQPESRNPAHKPLVFPWPPQQDDDQGEAAIIAVCLQAVWILT